MTHPSNTEQGSVLMWILVAVVLLAGLTFAMNQGSRTSTGMVTGQEARLAASEIIQYSSSVTQAVQKLLLRGCSESQLSFVNTNWRRANGDSVMPENPSAADGCGVFSSNEGGVQANIFPRNYFNSQTLDSQQINFGSGGIHILDIEEVGTELPDLMYHLPHLSKEICLQLNNSLGISNPGNEPPNMTISGWTNYEGNITSSETLTTDSAIKGRTVFCAYDSAGYRFVSVLIAR